MVATGNNNSKIRWIVEFRQKLCEKYQNQKSMCSNALAVAAVWCCRQINRRTQYNLVNVCRRLDPLFSDTQISSGTGNGSGFRKRDSGRRGLLRCPDLPGPSGWSPGNDISFSFVNVSLKARISYAFWNNSEI